MNYDLAVVGCGWAGFNAALKAKDLGLKTCLIEKSQIGGTCLNLGCIPTKTLIQSAKAFSLAKKSPAFGLEDINPAINFAKVRERKEKIILQLRQGMQFMLKGVDYITGSAQITSAQEIKVDGKSITAKNIIIATGSNPIELNEFKFDKKRILSSDDILNLTQIPNTLLIIGGGVIGCEFASLFCALGSRVTIIEKMPQLLPGEDIEAARKIENIFKKKGIKVNTNTGATANDLAGFDSALVCIGRRPKIDGLGLEAIGLNLERGRVVVDDYLRTNIANIYAAGDCTGKICLAHYASYQGIIAAENIANPANAKKADNKVVPNCIFTDPEIASVGLNEEKAKRENIEVEVKKFDFMASGMARILDETEGFVKIISDKKSGEILGGSIIGPRATELIAILTVAVSSKLRAAQLHDTIFAHPTVSESIHEALK